MPEKSSPRGIKKLDLYGLLKQETDNPETLPMRLEVREGSMVTADVAVGLDLARQFFKDSLNIEILLEETALPLTTEDLRKRREGFRLECCTEDAWWELIEELVKQTNQPSPSSSPSFRSECEDLLGLAHVRSGNVQIRIDELPKSLPRSYRSNKAALHYLTGSIIAHELLHLCGAWHPHAAAAEELVPQHSYNWETKSYNIMETLGGVTWVLERGEPAKYKSINRTATDFQRRQVRSFLRKGVAFRELEKRGFDNSELQDDTEAYCATEERKRWVTMSKRKYQTAH